MELDKLRQHFEQEAFNYDTLIPKLIPYYHEQHSLILNLIPFARNAKLKVLDLGTEIVLGASLHLTQQYEQLWREYMKKNGEKFSKYLEEDIPAVEEQLLWLSDIVLWM